MTTSLPRPTRLATLLSEAGKLHEQLITWRRALHQQPELSFHEHNTAAFIYETLKPLSALELSRPTTTSVVARLRTGRPGRTVAVRADIDALPIQEENQTPYRSRNDGVMHACGHDGHTAIVLALATLLSRHAELLHGEVRFLFQHAEEISPGGAEALVDAGVMDGVNEVIGLHLWASMPVGKIGIVSGPAMAAPDSFECTIIGQGGHAAMPHETIDPIPVTALIVSALQQVVTRQTDPLDPCVLSVTQLVAGTTSNVIPGSAYLAGTVRTFSASLRAEMPLRMERVVKGLCDAFGARYEFTYELGYRPVVNDPALAARLTELVQREFGDEVLEPLQPCMVGEDFSAYQQRAPGVFAFVGAGNVAAGIVHPHHHARFEIDEAALPIALNYLLAATLELLQV